MRVKIVENIQKVLPNTKEKRPIRIIADKMTPNNQTGHWNAMITPVPENPLVQSLLVPLMISSPPVEDHSDSGLAAQIRSEYQKIGVEDSQV